MAEILGEIVDGWTVNCPHSVAEEFAPKIKALLTKIDYTKQCCGCSKFYVATTLLHRECCDKSFCNGELFPCIRNHDSTCKKHNKNLEKFREEKEAQYSTGTVVDTRISKKQAEKKGLAQCSCHRYFAPEVKRKNSRGENVYYKSCITCRNKRKATPEAKVKAPEAKTTPERGKVKKMTPASRGSVFNKGAEPGRSKKATQSKKPRTDYIISFESFKEHLSDCFPKKFEKRVKKEFDEDVEVFFLPVSEEEIKKHAPNIRPYEAIAKIEILGEIAYTVYNTSSIFALWLSNFDEEVTDDEETQSEK